MQIDASVVNAMASLADGIYRIQDGVPAFHSVRTPTSEQLQELLSQII